MVFSTPYYLAEDSGAKSIVAEGFRMDPTSTPHHIIVATPSSYPRQLYEI